MLELTSDVIKILRSKFNKLDKNEYKDFDDYLAKKWKEIQNRANTSNYFANKYHKLEQEYKNKKAEIKKEEYLFQDKCEHEVTKYYPDPSGNNDSHTDCLICGKEVDRDTYRGL